jgi:hypothetical protein
MLTWLIGWLSAAGTFVLSARDVGAALLAGDDIGAMMIACCGNGDLWFGEVVDDGQFTAGLEARAIGDCYDTECVG